MIRTQLAVLAVASAAQIVLGQNLIAGGDFSSGLDGFETDYQVADQLDIGEGTLNVFTTGEVYRTFPAIEIAGPDHTTGDGPQLIVNGSPDAGVAVLRVQVDLPRPGRYRLTVFYTNTSFGAGDNDARLGVRVDGEQVGGITETRAAGIYDEWLPLDREFIADTAGLVTAEVFEASGRRSGNDFALDDLSLIEACRTDLDGDGELTIFDFFAFQGFFGLGDLRADFDGDDVLTIFDFLEFLTAFDAGCG